MELITNLQASTGNIPPLSHPGFLFTMLFRKKVSVFENVSKLTGTSPAICVVKQSPKVFISENL